MNSYSPQLEVEIFSSPFNQMCWNERNFLFTVDDNGSFKTLKFHCPASVKDSLLYEIHNVETTAEYSRPLGANAVAYSPSGFAVAGTNQGKLYIYDDVDRHDSGVLDVMELCRSINPKFNQEDEKRVWAVACHDNVIAVGLDTGYCVLEL